MDILMQLPLDIKKYAKRYKIQILKYLKQKEIIKEPLTEEDLIKIKFLGANRITKETYRLFD